MPTENNTMTSTPSSSNEDSSGTGGTTAVPDTKRRKVDKKDKDSKIVTFDVSGTIFRMSLTLI